MIDAALERDAEIIGAYLGHGATRSFPGVTERLERAGVPVHQLKEGVLEKIGTTRTPQPLLAVARFASTSLAGLVAGAADGFVLVAVDVADPGNLGTILRSAEAAGAAGVVVAGAGVDVRSPKVVRASAGAVFGVPIVEAPDAAGALAALADGGIRTLAAVVRGGADPTDVDLSGGSAIVVGNEARGLAPELAGHIDGTVTIRMAGSAESLNVAMAATVLCFEAARQQAENEGEGSR